MVRKRVGEARVPSPRWALQLAFSSPPRKRVFQTHVGRGTWGGDAPEGITPGKHPVAVEHMFHRQWRLREGYLSRRENR